ncbi:MAG TPA: PqqD family protein [Pyrinomonadaceae bacterium]|nr:PqqD family protein [Pyrinomonadaceae bacterium]
MKNNPKSRNANLIVQELEKEILIYDLNNNQAFCLNETSAYVWTMCNGENSVTDISETMSKTLKTRVPEEFIWLALDNLKSLNLLDESEKVEIEFNNLSRREVIKKVGLTSIIALPLIASVVAPSASMAQSGSAGPLPLFSACTTALECASRACSNNICCLSFGQMTLCTPAIGCTNNECCSGTTTTNLFGCASPFSCLCN